MKDLLKKYAGNALDAADTEGVENRLIETADDREQRLKWAKLLAENSIERATTPLVFSEKTDDTTVAEPVLTPLVNQNRRRFLMGIAAALVLAVGFFWFWNTDNSSATTLTDGYLSGEKFAAPSVRMGRNDDHKNWADAKNAYRDGQFDRAAELIAALASPSVEQQFYLALSYLYSPTKPDYAQAAAGFQKIITEGKGNFDAESHWFLALADIKLGKNADAKQNLEILLRGSNWQSEAARRLLKKL